MFTMAKVRASQHKGGKNFWYEHLSANDYYSENEKVSGHWFGRLSERYGVKDQEVTAVEFSAIQNNINPYSGGKLTPSLKANSVRFFDFQCSAQKSVSVMAVLMNDSRLTDAHRNCVRMALAELERFAATRIRKGEFRNSERTEITGNILAAIYHHDASRALDPQLHAHCVVANCTWSETEGRLKALTEAEMCKAIRYAGKCYQAAMARRVRELGYRIRIKNTNRGIEGFEIDGVSDELLERYSRRRAEIEREIAKFVTDNGREPTSAEIHIITRQTREAKLAEITTPEVREAQDKMLSDAERQQLLAVRRNAYAAFQSGRIAIAPANSDRLRAILGKAVDHLYERQSVAAGHTVIAEALNSGLGDVTVDDIRKVFAADRELVNLEPTVADPLRSRYSTLGGVACERQAIETITHGRNRFPALGRPAPGSMDKLASDQAAAVLGILNNQDFAVGLRGLAGSGKTTALQSLARGLAVAGRNCIYLAPTRSAVKVLCKDGFKASTVAMFMTDPPQLTKNSVLIVDESSLVSNRVGLKIINLACRSGARILFVGDSRQHVSVEAGDFLRIVETHSGMQSFELSNIKRQLPENYRAAIQAMASGRVGDGLEQFRRMNVVEECKAEYLDAAAKRYVLNTCAGKPTLLVAPTHREIETLTAMVRSGLVEHGKISAASISRDSFVDYNWTKQQLAAAVNYRPGTAIRFNLNYGKHAKNAVLTVREVTADGALLLSDGSTVRPGKFRNAISAGEVRRIEVAPGERLLLTANANPFGLVNGEIVEVKTVEPSGNLTLSDGRRIPGSFLNIAHGYATTSHKSQGMTTENVILAAADLDQRSCYVGGSRGRKTVRVYTPDYQHLLNGVRRPTERLAAQDILNLGKPR